MKSKDKHTDIEIEKKNKNFVQIYRENMPELRWLMINHSFASAVYFFIVEHMDGKNALACSYAIFEDCFNKGRTTIYRAIKTLEDNGFLTVMKMGTSNVYLVNSEVAWTSYDNQKNKANELYAKLDGNILVSKKENKDYIYRNQFDRLKALKEREHL